MACVSRAVVVTRFGGPEVLELQERPTPEPGPGELLVEVAVAGVNYRDVLERSEPGHAPLGEPPFAAGIEGAGRVVAVGPGVDGVAPGDRVAWWQVPGSYAEHVVVPVAEAVPVPDAVDDETACAVLLQGLTAHALVTSCYAVQEGDWVLVHAAAGGVGQLLTGMAKLRGARVVATTSSEAKAEVARAAGADAVLRYEEVPDAVRELTGGGVAVAYDAVGGENFGRSLRALGTGGVLVGYGIAGGRVPEPIDPLRLGRKSLFVTWMLLPPYVATRDSLLSRAADLFRWIKAGKLRVAIGGRYPLEEAGRAQADLAGRSTTGKLLLRVR